MNKFKIGDKVKCLHETLAGDKFYVIGKIHSFTFKKNKWYCSVIVDDLAEDELELINE